MTPQGQAGREVSEQGAYACRQYVGSVTSQLVRPRRGKLLGGVCAAIAGRFSVSPTVVRVGFVLFGLFGVGEIVYIALWIVIPKAD